MTYPEALISTAVILIGAVIGLLIGAGIGAIIKASYERAKPLGVAISIALAILALSALMWGMSQ